MERVPSAISSCQNVVDIDMINSITIQTIPELFLPGLDVDRGGWSTSIREARPYFNRNILAIARQDPSTNQESRFSCLGNSVDQLLPERDLTAVEIEIARRHIAAWHYASSSPFPVLILEDDVVFGSRVILSDLLHLISRYIKEYPFIDLCDSYIPAVLPHQRGQTRYFRTLEYIIRPKALTRTLSAYIISPELAHRLVEHTVLISLPIDMHLQLLFSRLNIKGITVVSEAFVHGSKRGFHKSSTS